MQTNDMLIRRGYLLAHPKKETDQMSAYYAALLLNKFGVLVDKPTLTSKEHVKLVSEFYHESVPASFYANPQHTKYFTAGELLIEQLVSYFVVENVGGVFSEDPEHFKRVEIFKKALPNYKEGEEVTFRNYKIITPEESTEVLRQIAADLALYTRKWSDTESAEFKLLLNMGYVSNKVILKSKDNAIEMFTLTKLGQFAKSLDRKDVVKLSVELIGEQKELKFTKEQAELLRTAIGNCYDTPMSKKQAKFFTQLTNKVAKRIKADNSRSPYRLAKQLIDKGQVVEAAKVFAKNGSLLERNLVWLISRAKSNEISQIIDLIEIKNPIVAVQLLQMLTKSNSGPRTFRFYKDRLIVSHNETDFEARYRKSIISAGVKEEVRNLINAKIDVYYANLPKLGKVFVSDEFKQIPMPINTQSAGSGLDVMPQGSRSLITGDYIRAFVHWKNNHDIDSSMTLVHESGRLDSIGFYNYSSGPFGDYVLHSGDNRSANGTEYIDMDLKELQRRGYLYAIHGINGFQEDLNKGEIYAGYQVKKDLKTQAWDPKNIAMQTKIFGNTRANFTVGFDIVNRQSIVINMSVQSGNRVLSMEDFKAIENLLDIRNVEVFNIHRIATLRASEIVTDPELADVVFDRQYVSSNMEQKVIKPFDVEKMVALLK